MDFVTTHAKKPAKQKIIIVIATVSFVTLMAFVLLSIFGPEKAAPSAESSVVPRIVSSSTPFPIYYPDPAKLPTGYILDKDSFSGTGTVVLYSVSYDNGKKIAFTLQKKPVASELETFYKNQLALRTEVETPLGTAAIGSINNQKFLSLPIKAEVWLIVTAPMDIDPDVLAELVKNLKQ
jgi:hypothetical protein